MRISERRLTNLRFADDILVIAGSGCDLQTMLSEMAVAVRKVGLELHYGKTTAMNNASARQTDGRRHLKVGTKRVKVLEEGVTTKYLGRALRLDKHNDAEIQARINIAWS